MTQNQPDPELVDSVHNVVRQHLIRLGEEEKWPEGRLAAAVTLLQIYFLGSTNIIGDIDRLEKKLGHDSRAAVRQRFANACYMNPALTGTPGQAQPWFITALGNARQLFRGKRKGARS